MTHVYHVGWLRMETFQGGKLGWNLTLWAFLAYFNFPYLRRVN